MDEDDETPLSWAEKIDQYTYMCYWMNKLGEKRLRKDCPRAENLALRVAVEALHKEGEALREALVSRLDRS